MKDIKVGTSIRWLHETHRHLHELRVLRWFVKELLDGLPPDQILFWSERRLAIDTHFRRLYDGTKINNSHNEQVKPPSFEDEKESAVGDEEE